MKSKSVFLRIRAVGIAVSVILTLIGAHPASATDWGVVAGSAAQSYQQAEAEAAIATQNSLDGEIARLNALSTTGTPQYDRMQALKQNSDQIYQSLMVTLRRPAQ